jgi:dolichyl-phosphate-mannose-protein mannosyltransferase
MTAPTATTERVAGGRWASWRWAAIALLAGAVIRVVYVWTVTRHDRVIGDQVYYSAQAHLNASGKWFVQPFDEMRPGADHPPLATALLTPITFLTKGGAFVMAQRWWNVALGLVNIVLLGALAKRLCGRRVAAVAMCLAAVQASWWMGDALVLSEPSSVLAVLLLLLAVVHAGDGPGFRTAALAGAAGGLAALGRPEMALLVPVLVAPTVGVGLRRSATRQAAVGRVAIALGASLCIVGPWVAWNVVRFEDRVLISSNDGFTLLGANCPSTYYGPMIGGYDIGCALAAPIPAGLDGSQASAIRSEIAVDYARAHLRRLPVVAAARLGRFAVVYDVAGEVGAGPGEGRPRWAMWIGVAQHWALLPFAVIGALTLPRRQRVIVLAVPAVSMIAAVTIASYWRLRVPADIALIVLAGAGLVAAWRRVRPPGMNQGEGEPIGSLSGL